MVWLRWNVQIGQKSEWPSLPVLLGGKSKGLLRGTLASLRRERGNSRTAITWTEILGQSVWVASEGGIAPNLTCPLWDHVGGGLQIVPIRRHPCTSLIRPVAYMCRKERCVCVTVRFGALPKVRRTQFRPPPLPYLLRVLGRRGWNSFRTARSRVLNAPFHRHHAMSSLWLRLQAAEHVYNTWSLNVRCGGGREL